MELFSEAVRDEERVVDRDAEADERDDVLGVDGDVGHAREDEHPRDPADDGEHAHPERDERRDDAPEHDEQQDERERERDRLGAAQVFLEHDVETVRDREHSGRLDLQAVRVDERAELLVVVACDREFVLHRDVDRDRVRVLRDEQAWVGSAAVVWGDDRRRPRVGAEVLECALDRGAELGTLRVEGRAREDEREGRPAGARELALDELRGAARLGCGDQPA